MIELAAHTDAGGRLVAVAEQLSEELAARAAEHDRENTFVYENFDLMRDAGYLRLAVPRELGGLVCQA